MSERSHPSESDLAALLVGKLKPILGPRMRAVVMAEYLTRTPPPRAVRALAALISKATSGGAPSYLAAAECLTATLSDDELLPYKSRARLYAAAKRAGLLEIARLFFDASPARASSETLAEQLAPERALVPRGRVLTLGERKSLARSHRRDLIQQLLRDPHPDVVRILLGNRHLTELDVLTLASRRPAVPAALALIAADPRWGTRYPVKRALAYNPYTPVHLAVRLITTMRAADLQAIAADPRLAQLVREQASSLLQHR